MTTIKLKVEMNLPQLIEWGFENDIRNKGFESERTSRAYFDYNGYLSCTQAMEPTDLFTVEVEEDVTEDTVFDKLISRYVFLSSKPSYAHAINVSIKEVIEDRKKATHIYFENEDNELQLIWRNGGLVE